MIGDCKMGRFSLLCVFSIIFALATMVAAPDSCSGERCRKCNRSSSGGHGGLQKLVYGAARKFNNATDKILTSSFRVS